MTVAVSSAAERLKNETWPLHQTAEQSPFQQMLVSGRLGREGYVEFLRQMRFVHAALEGHLQRATTSLPALANIVREYQYQAGYLDEDLRFFHAAEQAVRPLPATEQVIAEIDRVAARDPLALLGMHYVLEGSNNGSKYIARALQRALNLQPGPGLRYLDPYGDSQREYWRQFKSDLDAARFTDDEVSRLVEGARTMFVSITRVGASILSAMNITPDASAVAAAPHAAHGAPMHHGHSVNAHGDAPASAHARTSAGSSDGAAHAMQCPHARGRQAVSQD